MVADLARARSRARALTQRYGVTAPQHIMIEGFTHRLGLKLSVAALQGSKGR